MNHNRLIAKIDEKSKVTVVVTISTPRTKLPLLFVAKGIIQLGDVFNHWKDHSERGWINNEIFSEYLMHFGQHFNNYKPFNSFFSNVMI